MKNTKKQTLVAIALVSMLIVSSGVMALSVNAAVPDRDCQAYISVAPKVIGVGQTLTVNSWIWPSPSGPTFYARFPDPATGIYVEYRNVTVTFTRPDGSKDTFMPTHPAMAGGTPGATLPCGDIFFFYKPTQAGTWSVVLSFPGQTFYSPNPLGNESVYYKPSTSQPFTFIVTEEKQTGGLLDGSPYSPLPTGYWERPINTDNREWTAISGPWLRNTYDNAGSCYNPYSTAPGSAHVVWTKEAAHGGIIGGEWGSTSYPGGCPGPAVAMNGKYYLNNLAGGTFSCYDLRTGEKLYTATGTISQAQHLTTQGSAAMGASGYAVEAQLVIMPILWEFGSTTWKRYDPLTGGLVQTITNVPTLDATANAEGRNDFYVCQRWGWNTTIPLRYAGIYLSKWDYSKVTGNNWQTGVVWNASLRQPDGRAPSDNVRGINILPFYTSNVVIANAVMEDWMAGYDMTTGARLYVKDFGFAATGRGPASEGYGIISFLNVVANKWVAFDVKTGNKLWEMDPPFDAPWGGQSAYSVVAGDKFYSYSTDGNVRASEMATGKQIWKTSIGRTNETVYNTWPAFSVQSGGAGNLAARGGADKTFFTSTGISWGTQPFTRFHRLRAYNMDTGDLLWSISGIFYVNAIADGYLVGANSMDGKIYTFGKGKTETAVSIQNNVIAKGGSALIEGTVMDISPAQPNTPAVAKESMTEWMEYLHMQNATTVNSPPTPKGVPVTLYAVDPNGNIQDIGTVTTDSMGHYEILWKPPVEGTYKVLASFAGDDSYWSSAAEAALGVTEAPSAVETGAVQSAVASDNTMMFVGSTAAIIIAIAIVGLLLFRKKQ